MKKRLVLFALAISIILCGCVSKSDYSKLEQRVADLERRMGIDNSEIGTEKDNVETKETMNFDYRNVKIISLCFEYDMKEKGSTGDTYILSDKEYFGEEAGKSHLQFFKKGGRKYDCDFSIDTFNELLDMICNQPLEEYKDEVDSNGKIIYKVMTHMLYLEIPGMNAKPIYLKDPANMDEIIAFFERLGEAAMED